MLHAETDNFLGRVRQALTLPIRSRCAELTVLFDRGSSLDLQNFFPLLIDDIFGPQSTSTWCLRTARIVDEDFRVLEHFLSPNGPVFKLIYNLLKDPSAKYDFPIMYLPSKVQQSLENAQNHPFYADLVHVNPQTKHVISLLLNPFDYFMFHFAYHLINPVHQRTASDLVSASWNTVYYVLACEYMLHFLPTDPSVSVLPVIFYNGKSPIQQFQQIHKVPTGSKLINSSLLNKPIEDYTMHHNFGRHPRNQIWRSETVLTVFIDLWFNNDRVSQDLNQINNSFNTSQHRLLQYNQLPTTEYMRIVRVLIKQLHSFSASAKIDDTHLSELKKIAIPMVEGKFYIFLRNLIHKWPLDGSFRLVLELWLTYLQPWRYPPNTTDKSTNPHNLDADENMTSAAPLVDRLNLPFIAENLLVYVVIFQQLLPRFSRVDLVSPKMSIMLFRISKVFNQLNLATFLREIEQCMDINHSPTHTFNSHWASNLPPLNPTANWSTNTSGAGLNYWSGRGQSTPIGSPRKPELNPGFPNGLLGEKKWSVMVKQRIFELEGPVFCYKPLFSKPVAPEVFDLLQQIRRSIKVAKELVDIKKQEQQEIYSSFSGLMKSFFGPPKITDDFSLTERLKVPEYLEKSLENLMELFEITNVPEADPDVSFNSHYNQLETNDLRFLTPEKVSERASKIKYEGDPDLHPIRSTEVAFLVRMFYQIALLINEKFTQKFCQFYYDQSFYGRFSRQFLSPPITIYRFDKTKPGSPRVARDLPPRISLRRFASYRTLSYLGIGALICYFLGYNMPVYVICLAIFCLIYKSVKALWSAPVRHNYPTQGFGNISFDDSF